MEITAIELFFFSRMTPKKPSFTLNESRKKYDIIEKMICKIMDGKEMEKSTFQPPKRD